MKEMDGQLRDLLDAAVGEPPHRVSVEAVRRRVFRRRLIEYVSAATGAAVIAAAVPVGIGALGRSPAAATGSVAPTVYVLSTEGTLTPVPVTTDIPGQPIPLGFGTGAQMMAATPDGKTIYVTQGMGSVTPVSTVTNKAGEPIPVSQGSVQILITPDGKTAYVLSYQGQTLTPITTATNTPGKAINVGSSPGQANSMAITPDGKTLYVLASPDTGGPESGPPYLLPISTATNKPGNPIRIDMAFPESIVISPDGKTAYIIGPTANGSQTSVIPVATATNTPGPAVVAFDGPAFYQAITPDGKTIYLGVTGGLIPFATATDTPGKLIKIDTRGVWATPDERTLYVFGEPRLTPGVDNSCTNPGDIKRLPTIPRRAMPVLTVTNLPGARRPIRLPCIASIFAISPNGQTVWAAGANILTPISTATNISGKPIKLGGQIGAIIVTP